MAYYQILKKRRLDLNLSIQDIAIQTHLSPEFIRAIEENNLDVFSDDFSFVRYFVHSYADVIGVNWAVIAPEVDATISAYAHARDMAITQAQRKMIENMPAAKKKGTKKRRRRKHIFSNMAGALSRKMNWDPKNQLSRTLIFTAIGALTFLAVLSLAVDALSERNIRNAELAKQEELKKKEEETQRLADQFKSQKDASSQAEKQENAIPVTVTAAADTVNGFTVENALSDSEPISIAFQCAAQMSVTVYVNGTQNTSHTFDQSWTYTFQSGTDTLIELEISGYQANDQITVNNTAVPLQETGFTDGYGVVTLQFTGSANQSSQDQSSDQSQEPDQLNTEQTPTQEDYSQSEEYVESGQGELNSEDQGIEDPYAAGSYTDPDSEYYE
ncbi:helix-turn-helix domain-containing protein [Ileibacterium valens]|uniref:helix-turn-helix domain-containing protein n=1 Tax=Ileibacterium valens TaxID=1862668 RepID=UPI00259B0A48|nr:helix-turn-helix transcriptional regulator [Ileibacterium valens]